MHNGMRSRTLKRPHVYALAALVVLAVVSVGTAYALLRPTTYESTAVIALSPRPDVPTEDIPSLAGSFTSSAAAGTYVELVLSKDVLEQAGSPPVTVSARAVPDSRAITVTTAGDAAVVRPALASVLRAAALSAQELNDVWELRVLQAARPPVAAGPSRAMIVGASIALAAFGVLLLLVVLRHLGLLEPQPRPGARGTAPDPDDAFSVPVGR